MRMLLTLPLGFLSMFSDERQPVISHELDPDGNWEVGAMFTLIDDVGAASIYSAADHVKASLDFNISFHSTARTQEEVEIEAKVIAEKGKLSLVVVEIRRKRNGGYH
ncbi:hypothetical protein Goari_004315 [Gossypium aridum]|uniref:Thioesterase domain-containing protein n=1 Tax=Gossypium aridum TaxID=34290 RepID=A0A7J8Y4S9_GOSAI|nr:hypothetical protein [Gossypium aridum]